MEPLSEIEELCSRLNQATTTEGVKELLSDISLSNRNTFNIAAQYVPSKPIDNKLFADKIIEATTCSGMTGLKIVSWNIDSLRAGIIDFSTAKCGKQKRTIQPESPMGQLIKDVDPDIICLQETKLKQSDENCFNIQGYHTYWNSSTQKQGYSGVSLWTKTIPNKITTNLPTITGPLDMEGRIITAFFDDFVIVNTYTPNTLRAGTKPLGGWKVVKDPTKRAEREQEYNHYIDNRQRWDMAIMMYLLDLRKNFTNVIWCGDMNIARSYIDIHNGLMSEQKLENAKKRGEPPSRLKELERRIIGAQQDFKLGGGAGLRLEEREGLDRILQYGFVDVFRTLYPDSYGFTYWDRTKIAFRKANNGWRIDYFIVSPNLLTCIRDIRVFKEIGETHQRVPSDHAPLVLFF
jgi:exodeoxyribonuclease III